MLISGSNQENGQAPSKLNGFTSRIFQTLNSSILRILWMRTSQHAKEEIVKKCILKQVKGWWQFSKASDQPPDSTMTSNTMMTKRDSDSKDIPRRRSFLSEMINLNMKSHNFKSHNSKSPTSINLINFNRWVRNQTINKMIETLVMASSNMTWWDHLRTNSSKRKMPILSDSFLLSWRQKLFKTRNFPSRGTKITLVNKELVQASISKVIVQMKDNLLLEDCHLVPKCLATATTFKSMMVRGRDNGNRGTHNQLLLCLSKTSMDKTKQRTI